MQAKEELAKSIPDKETLLTIGVFDGVHLGHQHLLTHLRQHAQKENLLSGVVTFRSHPQTVISPESKLPWLNNLDERIGLLQGLGIDIIVALTFTPELAKLSAREFIQLLKDHLRMRGLIIGPDFALGKNREGDVSRLRLLGKEMGFSVEVAKPLTADDEVISSTTIRQALARGNVKRVEKLIGRPFSLSGQVVPGDKRGRLLGFPTANLDTTPEQALPHDGVYATIAYINHKQMPSVTNIGVRPTFGGGKRVVEVYLLDYKGQSYGEKLKIDLVDKLRDEMHFNATEELKAQIERDVEQAIIILEKRISQ